MIRLQLPEVVEAIAGRVVGEQRRASVSGVSTDSRRTRPGELFFAIAGERYDGHAFVGQALQAGAVAAVVARGRRAAVAAGLRAEYGDESGRLIEVDDTVVALGRLASYHRSQLAARVVAIVGSNGKTTTKALVDHVLGERFPGRASPRSFNNAIGVPLTLLSAVAADEYLVVEIGTNAPGEVLALGRMAAPDLAVVTSIGEEHLEGLGDLEGVAAEECSILGTLRRGGFAAVNTDEPRVMRHVLPYRPEAVARLAPGEDAPSAPAVTLVTFGREAQSDLRITECRFDEPWLEFAINRRFRYRIRTPAPHMAANATAAIAVARRFGLEHADIARRLESFEMPAWRSEVLRLRGATVIHDAYNANPASVAAALSTLANVAGGGRRIVVFGEMRELGAHSAALHRTVAARVACGGVDVAVLVGVAADLMRDEIERTAAGRVEVFTVPDAESAGEWLAGRLREGDAVLIKGSRAVGLERALEGLRHEEGAGAAA